jgi:hypothetical protein
MPALLKPVAVQNVAEDSEALTAAFRERTENPGSPGIAANAMGSFETVGNFRDIACPQKSGSMLAGMRKKSRAKNGFMSPTQSKRSACASRKCSMVISQACAVNAVLIAKMQIEHISPIA